MKISGTHINYYFHCIRHLWLFAHNIQMEHTSELVEIGKFISESTYERKNKEILIEEENFIYVIDFFDERTGTVHEIKKTDRMEELHIWQLKFYLYRLKNLGFENIKGILDYPKLRKTIKVELFPEDEDKLENIFKDIKNIISQNKPPKPINKPFCRKCSYFEICYV